MMIALIRTKMREAIDAAAYEVLSARMHELASQMAGFISIKSYVAEDGDEVSVAIFESAETLAAWRNQPEHLEAQRRGREEFFDSYSVQVCEVVRAYDFSRASGRNPSRI